jgi:hypothetical protein
MTLFFRRFIGALVLDAGIYEDIEADRHAALQSAIVVAAVCVAGGIAGMGLGFNAGAFASGAVVALGGWLVWAAMIVALGTSALAEPQTRSNVPQLLRVLGYAAAPGVFAVLAAMPAAAPFVLLLVSLWMVAAAVVAVRQALDYRSTTRAIAVCVIGWLLSAGIVGAALMMFTRPVS